MARLVARCRGGPIRGLFFPVARLPISGRDASRGYKCSRGRRMDHEYAIRAAVEEFRSSSYQRVLTTGGPVEGTGGYINDYQTAASVGADLLTKSGLPNEFVQMVPSRVMDRDRTYGSAVALRNWFRQHNMPVR